MFLSIFVKYFLNNDSYHALNYLIYTIINCSLFNSNSNLNKKKLFYCILCYTYNYFIDVFRNHYIFHLKSCDHLCVYDYSCMIIVNLFIHFVFVCSGRQKSQG